jgi:hypothetical protein
MRPFCSLKDNNNILNSGSCQHNFYLLAQYFNIPKDMCMCLLTAFEARALKGEATGNKRQDKSREQREIGKRMRTPTTIKVKSRNKHLPLGMPTFMAEADLRFTSGTGPQYPRPPRASYHLKARGRKPLQRGYTLLYYRDIPSKLLPQEQLPSMQTTRQNTAKGCLCKENCHLGHAIWGCKK